MTGRRFLMAWALSVGLAAAGCSDGGFAGPDAHGGDNTDGAAGRMDGRGNGGDATAGSDGSSQGDTGSGGEDVTGIDGTGAYDVAPSSDVATGCDAGTCAPHALGCVSAEICGDGLDNNCDGHVDESCPCVPGTVQRCFLGPPGSRNVGACQDGMQTCQGAGEFGTWSACAGGISPSGETCDHLDNDCNGCVDEGLCCSGPGSCPGPGDPRIPTGQPFQTLTLHGNDFLAGGTRYQWHVEGGPCDQLLWATSSNVSYTFGSSADTSTEDFTGETLDFHPTLSGDYTVTLTITRSDGTTLTCTFILPVRASGLRVELCWDTTGDDDLDLWLHRPGSTADWPTDGTTTSTNNSCFYANCRNPRPVFGAVASWGHADTPGGACREPDGTTCHNPRLDLDNIATPGAPENINLDTPHNNDRFRVAVNYYGSGFSDQTVHPMVNIYCGGVLQATYGGADVGGTRYGSAPITGFNTSGANSSGSLWRVADVSFTEPGDHCTLAPLHPTGSTSGACVRNDGNRTYDGTCSP